MATDLKFGTSGLRGLVSELDGPPAQSWTRAFLALLQERGDIRPGDGVLVGRDLRASSPAIAARVHAAIRAAGSDALHHKELEIINMIYCHVMSSDELLALMKRA